MSSSGAAPAKSISYQGIESSVEIGVVGKPNVGKSTFFSAATLAPAEIANYPFTTIEPNRGVTYIRSPCPHVDSGKPCNPNNAPCDDGTRLIPVDMLDVAGLVPRAHEGRGLGNQFLDDLRQASALVHVVDASGTTDFEGNACPPGEHDPVEDVRFLEEELAHWISGIIQRGWEKLARRSELEEVPVERALHEKLTGLGFTETQIHLAIRDSYLDVKPTKWSKEDMLRLGHSLQLRGKPMVIAANKWDIAPDENIEKLKSLEGRIVVPTSSEFELALRRAAKTGIVDYLAGSPSFSVKDQSKLSADQSRALQRISRFLERAGSTGVQMCIEETVRKLLNLIVIYPVEDELHWTDKKGNVLPDAYLVPRGSTARDVAFKVHTDLGKNFIRAINARTKMVVGHDYEAKDGDVLKIVARA